MSRDDAAVSAPPELVLPAAHEQLLATAIQSTLYTYCTNLKKVLACGKLKLASNWLGGIEISLRDESTLQQIVAKVGEAEACAIRDNLTNYCTSVKAYLEAHGDAVGLQRQAAVDQTTLPVQNFNQNIIQLTREQMLREMFDKYDTDKDGFLDSGSYREFLKGISVWGNGQYNDDDWEFKWPEECALLKSDPAVGVSYGAFDGLYREYRSMYCKTDYDQVKSGRGHVDYNAKSSTGYVGLSNQGATCYMNSLLQGLFMTPELRKALFQWLWTEGRDSIKKECIPYQMQKLFVELATSDRRDAETTGLTQSFGWTDADAFEQHDVNEMFDILFEALENSFEGTRGDGLIQDMMYGKQKDFVRCTECGHESKQPCKFNRIDIAIRQFGDPEPIRSVQEGLAKFFKAETLDGDNKWTCPKCQKPVCAQKGLGLVEAPYVLSIGMKRFDYDWMADERVKVNDAVSFDLLLNVAEFLDRSPPDEEEKKEEEEEEEPAGDVGAHSPPPPDKMKVGKGDEPVCSKGFSGVVNVNGQDQMLYELYAIFIHSGGAMGGHYYAYIQDFGTKQWFEFNDSTISGPLNEAQIQQAYGGAVRKTNRFGTFMSSSSAYMLMYRRQEPEVNIDDLSSIVVPKRLMDDLAAEKERARQERREAAAARRAEKERRKRAEDLLIFAACFERTLKVIQIDKAKPWSECAPTIYAELGMDKLHAAEDCRISRLQPNPYTRHMHGCGSLTDVVTDVETPLAEVRDVVNQIVMVQARRPGQPWPSGPRQWQQPGVCKVYYTNADGGNDYCNYIEVPRGTPLGELKQQLIEELGIGSDHTVVLKDAFGQPVTGSMIYALSGDATLYSDRNVHGAIRALIEANAPGGGGPVEISPESIDSYVRSHAQSPDAQDVEPDGVQRPQLSVYNLTRHEVRVSQRVRSNQNGFYGTTQLLLKMVLKPRQQYGAPNCFFDRNVLETQSYSISVAHTRDFDYRVTASPRQHVFIFGEGPDDEPLREEVTMLQVTANRPVVVEAVAPISTVHTVPIYLYKGSRDDMTGFLFDMEVDETIRVSAFKVLLAAKMMEHDPNAFPEVDPAHLRVREFASNDPKWVGAIFMDKQTIIEPVSKFVGGEKFAVSVLDGPETKTEDSQPVITVWHFDVASYSLSDDHMELVVDKEMSVDDLRDRIANISGIDADRIALASVKRLQRGEKRRTLTGTVADMEKFAWDWDLLPSAKPEDQTLSDCEDQDVFYYRDKQAEMPELTDAQKEELTKKAVIAARKKKNEGKTVYRPEAQVRIRGANALATPAPAPETDTL